MGEVGGGGTDTKIKSRHRELTLEKKILPKLLPGLEPETLQSRVWYLPLSHIPTPQGAVYT